MCTSVFLPHDAQTCRSQYPYSSKMKIHMPNGAHYLCIHKPTLVVTSGITILHMIKVVEIIVELMLASTFLGHKLLKVT